MELFETTLRFLVLVKELLRGRQQIDKLLKGNNLFFIKFVFHFLSLHQGLLFQSIEHVSMILYKSLNLRMFVFSQAPERSVFFFHHEQSETRPVQRSIDQSVHR